LIISLFAIVLLSGCTIYTVEKIAADGSTTTVKVRSSREFQQPDLHYSRNGTDAEFDFKAQSATSDYTDMMTAMMSMWQMMMAVQPLAPAASGADSLDQDGSN
jgi:hypothetical protein